MSQYPHQSFPWDRSRSFAGQWITNETFRGAEPINVFHRQLDKVKLPETPLNQHILFRKRFTLRKPESATLYITADDCYRLFINGAFVTQGPCPGYPFHYYYNAIDVTPYLADGENVIAAHTYYQGLINRVWVSGDNRHGLLLDLVADGGTVLSSDRSFVTHIHTGFSQMGKSGYETQFLERYDSGSGEAGFAAPEFDDSGWAGASVRAHADYALYEQPTPQLDFERVAPALVEPIPGGVRVDFGAMYVGKLAVSASGNRGDTVRILCGQELNADGSVRYNLRCNCRFEEEWILSGGDDTLYQFDYKAFRYAELLYPDSVVLEPGSLTLVAQHYPFELSARCESADPDHRAVFDLCVRSLKYGAQEVIQDCMEREKGQYLGDGCYSAIAHAALSGDPRVLEKLVEDSLRSAFVNKGLMTCTTCSLMQEIADYPLWLPMLVRMYAALTGKLDRVAAWYDGIVDILEFYRIEYERGGLLYDLDKWCVVEWPATARDGYDYDITEGRVCKGTHNVINAYYVGAVKATNKLAAMVGRPQYRDHAPLLDAYLRAFYDEDSGLFRDAAGSNHCAMSSNAAALYLGLCPDKRSERAVVDMIRRKRLSAGMFYSTWAAFWGLWRVGEKALVLDLIRDKDGWLRMLREGATATFEGWGKDSKWNTSLFHLTFTFPALFLTEWGVDEALE
ncbi:MAG: family 78 glycoside hydrolase catalytic domain [Oscillospiraceae bacterium]|jgi:hypothetical protein|nr:family 78 glycoside hydrolase catalytic domain [Oscillospiraceae bacterium]